MDKLIVNGMNGCNGVHGVKDEIPEKDKSIVEFLNSVFDLSVEEVVVNGKDRAEPVIRFKNPEELGKILDLEIRDQPESHSGLLEQCRKVIKYSVKTGHPRFYNQLYGGLDPYGFAGQVVTDALNTSIYTYEVAPAFTLMENVLLNKFCDVIGYEGGDGTFSPGGSYSNMLGMNLARFNKFPDVKSKGAHSLPRMVAFASEHCHYSNAKNASLLGVGSDNVIKVKCDARGKMDPLDLERCIVEAKEDGAVPFLVVGTAGTTVLGAFDPLNEIADVCQRHQMWFHVDAAWGGGTLFSKKHKHLCDGIHRSDSVAWNPHKMLMAPLQCCVFVTKHINILKECHSMKIPYLFQQDKKLYSTDYDVGSKVIQCGRKVDALKFWLMWKAHGNNGFRVRVDKAFENAKYLLNVVEKTEGFQLVIDPECTNVCFWYVPKSMRATEWDLSDKEFCRKLSLVAPVIKQRMTEKGSMLVGYQPLGNLPNFFRMIVLNDDVTHDDMDFVVKEIDELGRDL